MSSFSDFLKRHSQRVNTTLEQGLQAPEQQASTRLIGACQHSLLKGGKRVRPLFVYAAAYAIDEPTTLTDRAAAAVECIHAYSLIHDDLPAMDDDALRRGVPTCHIAFDEATAILAGDGLQAKAFEYLSESLDEPQALNSAATQLTMCGILAKASGIGGMVAGQSIDLNAVGNTLDLEQLMTMHRLKTGALIQASVSLGALSTHKASASQLDALHKYTNAVGLAFQIQDDILDVTADTKTLGKQQGADIAHNKPTFVSLLGLDQAKKKTQTLLDDALDALSRFDYRADYLRDLAAYVIQRKY